MRAHVEKVNVLGWTKASILLLQYQGSNNKQATLFTFYNIFSKILLIFIIAYIFLCTVIIWMLPFYCNSVWYK